ncbi:mannose-6-phosphate isomerase, class I [Halochromatium roseum]|uniref:mannose-6-phosphate isomerase, class I n=1 Tax=Halochromatium roseum TaxID=391920 RepID=UPI0019149558|nr:mannose-6-phosphate isomerase, class I [Halochromatium roseum]MBK5939164.1 mannose-6-phosphate isomerase, class I [Halochromatium roseum]
MRPAPSNSPVGSRAFIPSVPAADELQAAISAFEAAPQPLILHCGVQHYSWGDPDFIPALMDLHNPRRLPFAELWIGAHPDLLSTVQLNGWRLSLAELIRAAPTTMLGAESAARFDHQLPFLLKIIAAREPLSIQAHPTREQAIAGYQREDAIGLQLTDPRRSYRDRNHKPELLVALTDFYALRGFRPLAEVSAELAATPELASLKTGFEPSVSGLFQLYQWLMKLEQPQIDALLSPLIRRLQRERAGIAFDPTDRHAWLLEADRLFSINGHRDRGLFSLLLLNLIALHPGAALFLPAGELHAYLRGAAIELMANSNNVLRGGLTQKHIDVPALLNTLSVNPAPGAVHQMQPPAGPAQPETYPTPAAEFLLERHRLSAGEHRQIGHCTGTSIIKDGDAVDGARLRLGLVMDGQLSLHSPGQTPLRLKPGSAFVIPAACSVELHSEQHAVLFTARAP